MAERKCIGTNGDMVHRREVEITKIIPNDLNLCYIESEKSNNQQSSKVLEGKP